MQTMDDQPLYRFMDLFELYELAVNKKLKFTKLRLMPDQNEGLGSVLHTPYVTPDGEWCPMDREDLLAAHKKHREGRYISCWTKVPDAMAMWLLYSRDHSAVRVKTSLEKLQRVLHGGEFGLLNSHSALAPGVAVPMLAELSPVEYVDFKRVHRDLLARFDNLNSRRKRLPCTTMSETELHALADAYCAIFMPPNSGHHLKDAAYEHEKEVRASFELRIRNAMRQDDVDRLPDNLTKLLWPMLDAASAENSPDVFTVPVGADFIEEICFDPRMPSYRQAVIRQMLDRDDVPFTTSSVFGNLIDHANLAIPGMS